MDCSCCIQPSSSPVSAVREAEALRARETLATAAAAAGRVQLSGLEAQSQAARTRLEEVGRELE